MSDEPVDLQSLKRDVAHIRFVMVLLIVLAMGFLALINLVAVSSVPRFELIFMEMLGDKSRLPVPTKAVISYSRLGAGLAPYVVAVAVPGLAVLGLLLGSRTRVIPFLCVAVMAFQILHFVMINAALYAPLVSTGSPVGERSE
jgi:hypothetical protein